jgi:hypothetical protein
MATEWNSSIGYSFYFFVVQGIGLPSAAKHFKLHKMA